MTDQSPFAGLLEHMQRYLGEVTHAEPPDFTGRNRGFGVGFHRHPDKEMVSAATTGVRFQEVEARMPEEFVCSALPDQEAEAGYLVHVVADRVVRSGKGHEYGGGYLNAEPLIPDTEVADDFMQEHDLHSLVAHWREKDTDILDIHRPSAV